MAHRVTLIPGDGIGPELAEATTRVLDATGIGFEWERVEAGEAAIASHGAIASAIRSFERRRKPQSIAAATNGNAATDGFESIASSMAAVASA